MKRKKCTICGTKIKDENNGLFLQENYLCLSELTKLQKLANDEKKGLCIKCKEEMLFANIISVI